MQLIEFKDFLLILESLPELIGESEGVVSVFKLGKVSCQVLKGTYCIGHLDLN